VALNCPALFAFATVIIVLLALGGCTSIERALGLSEPEQTELPAVEAPVTDPVAYSVRIEGSVPEPVEGPLRASLRLLTEQERLPASLAALSKRVDDDVARAKDVLASEGYYEAKVETSINPDVEPVEVVLTVDPGPQYRLSAVEITYQPAEPATPVPIAAADVGLEVGAIAAGAALVEAERRTVRLLQENGYPNAALVERRYLANRDDQTVRAEWTVETGPFAQFGPLTVEGLQEVDPEYVELIADWRPGTIYDIREIERVRQVLSRTALFATITPPPQDNVPIEDGTVPVVFTVTEAPAQSIGIGVFYSTDEQGAGGAFSWEHRNLFGSAERLRIDIEGSLIRQSAEVDFRKPAFFALNQSLLANVSVLGNETDAYEGITGTGILALEREFAKYWRVSAGPAFVYTDITRSAINEDGERFLLGGGRVALGYDSRDNPLDPTRGLNGTAVVSPFASMAFTSTQFVIADSSLAGYQGVLENDRVVLAARARVGSIVGASNAKVPASQRFYAGGGGSVRGYEFQSIGPLDDDDDPLGGRSLIEVNAEARIKIIEQFGVVPFVDGGQVYEEVYPELDGDLQWAAGLGLRYYSPVGPIRLDVAFPVNPRPVDDLFQFYIAIGQAF
jgi:translocation and assembly module TamA